MASSFLVYRGAFYITAQGEIPFTKPEHSGLSDADLLDLALSEAVALGIVGTEAGAISEASFLARLRVLTWSGVRQT